MLFWWLSALIALPTVVYAGQPFFTPRRAPLEGAAAQYGCADLARHHSRDRDERLSDRPRERSVYFDAAVSLLFFLLIGRFLDERLRVRARAEAQNLLSLQRGIATVIGDDGLRRLMPAHALQAGDRVLITSGERVPADGTVIQGAGEVDQKC